MQPLRLQLKDFCTHAFTEFSFDEFQSAIIIGKVKDNDKFSNGSGKSTIFNALKYVIYNETHFSSLDRVIRHHCDICRVEFDFISSVNKNTYRIVRSNSRKTGTDVRLFQLIGNEWQDLSQRRVSDTEKEIIKIIGFNYKCFCASVLFNQSGSENNTEKDFGNIASLTPEKRKSVLREVLQLNVYANYEKFAKSKLSSIQINLEKQRAVLAAIGDPNSQLDGFVKELNEINASLDLCKDQLSSFDEKEKIISTQFNLINDNYQKSISQILDINNKLTENTKLADKYGMTANSYSDKIKALHLEGKNMQLQIKNAEELLSKHNSSTIDYDLSNKILIKINEDIAVIKADIATSNKQILTKQQSSVDDEETCSKCHQSIPSAHRHTWQLKIDEEIDLLNKSIANFNELLNEKLKLKNKITNDINSAKIIEDKKTELTFFIKNKNQELEAKRSLYKNYLSLKDEHEKLLVEKLSECEQLKSQLQTLQLSQDNTVVAEISRLKSELIIIREQTTKLSSNISNLTVKKAIVEHQIGTCNSNIEKISLISQEIKELEKTALVHSKVIQAFGSNGIPALITQSVLDEFQQEANNWMTRLRPGLQLQFVVINEKNKKEQQEDTLEIVYFIDGEELEYKQLSGAQKIIASLSLKLGILFILNKRLGANIQLMLLDEVDQALDEGSTEIFSDIVKVIQSELKVLVITHDDTLKHKFSHAIMVEQNENNVSKAKLIKW